MPRWSELETALLREVRLRLGDEISNTGQYPEVIGDRPIIRFIRGHQYQLEKILEMYGNYLKWRRENDVDTIREMIVNGGFNHPFRFPNGEKIIRLYPQITILADAHDKLLNPITVETYNFSPSRVLKEVTHEEYRQFMIFSLEFKAVVLEQMAEQRERDLMKRYEGHPPEAADGEGYGVVLQCCTIRDLNGVGMEFLGSDAKQLIKLSLEVAQANYPEMLSKSHIINAPWIFSTIWYFVKGLIDARTAAKVSIIGSDFMSYLTEDIDVKMIPNMIPGGLYPLANEEFVFDVSVDGLLSLHIDKESAHHHHHKLHHSHLARAAEHKHVEVDAGISAVVDVDDVDKSAGGDVVNELEVQVHVDENVQVHVNGDGGGDGGDVDQNQNEDHAVEKGEGGGHLDEGEGGRGGSPEEST